ncbi:MAG: glutamine--tRNA ligase/YqeY domain fusion protein [Bacteroidetes bacterium]|nr:glutamine--tRNA ligase/YqeY domain fusion protein [Bacteroidota bacterium]MBU1373069.1 glutamine--tRNA ligase/YqeY domain fusion protein [Bacteroidota bacterium]MBU1484250.1 glutamine--tRNA ligase/YqeY domain fusion protein [Bacteroidota bacterium]MBU1759957.1 glutamine--tRNA ligase/YqeY domain fusion protein [Bacteroidota bacterium]MBU2268226.1 glutamine--tRNA ligase/YqeY domain fusion protein [Bacteroidota bacterium]
MSEEKSLNFIEEIVENDLKAGKYDQIVTRFPPEPNGFLHIGHASSICLNFGLTQKFNGYTNLRFDDTNPVTEETIYVDSIKKDIAWLGFQWKNELYASDYFDLLYSYAVKLIEKGLAYVDELGSEEMAKLKGTHTEPGKDSPFRNRSVAENLDLFERMKNGEFPDGSRTLRAKIDMTHVNMLMRDPILYRIKHAKHHRTGNKWCVYPMYDFAHGQSDAIEHVTHSVCTLEFIPHRELYNWLIAQLEIYPSHQYEFARRNVNYTVTSKRKLLQLVNEKFVSGWDDPRMPTISGLRRRGFTPSSIRNFCERIGIAKRENLIEYSLLEFFIREDLNRTSWRRMAVLDPIKMIITNYPEGQKEMLPGENNPEVEGHDGERQIPFSRELWIERDDFMEEPPKKFFRLGPGLMSRLKSAYIVRCDDFVKDANGNVTEIHCTYFPDSKSGEDTSGLKVKGTMHWVSVPHAKTAEVRLYDRLFTSEEPDREEGDFKDYINPESLVVVKNAFIESDLANASKQLEENPDRRYQFIRKGYFCLDADSTPENLVFNRTVTLKDTWAKESQK